MLDEPVGRYDFGDAQVSECAGKSRREFRVCRLQSRIEVAVGFLAGLALKIAPGIVAVPAKRDER